MIALQRYVLLDLDVVYTLEDGKSMAYTGHAHLLQVVMLQSHQCFSNNLVFYGRLVLSYAINLRGSLCT